MGHRITQRILKVDSKRKKLIQCLVEKAEMYKKGNVHATGMATDFAVLIDDYIKQKK